MDQLPTPASDLLLVSSSARLIRRAEEVARDYGMALEIRRDLDELLDRPVEAGLVVGDAGSGDDPHRMAAFAQLVKQISPGAFVVCGVRSRMKGEELAFVKKSGCGAVLLEEEFHETGKLDFLATQIVRAAFVPVKPDDFQTGLPLPADLFHLLPQRRKFLPVAFQGDTLTEARMARLRSVPELYIRRTGLAAYSASLAGGEDPSAAGLFRRCRASFLALHSAFIDLVLFLGNQAEHSSFSEGERLLGRCRELAGALLVTLGSTGSAWRVINNSSVGDLGSVERTSAIAAYAGLIALQLGLDGIEELMVCALIAELGMVFLPPAVLRKIREGRGSELTPDELARLAQYPGRGVDAVLQRKVPLPESMRRTIFDIHARHDGGEVRSQRRSIESQVIRLAIELDRGSRLELGRKRADPAEVLRSVLSEERERPSRFSPEFSFGLRRALDAIQV